jgi:hypothetical protein
MTIQELTDRALLKELIDNVSILADKKDFHSEVQFFSEHAISETFAGGQLLLKLTGRKEMEVAFEEFLKNIEHVYHFNGQQTLSINGDHATGTSYCMITLIGMESGQKVKNSIAATYQDDYVRENGTWLIAKRIGNFNWQDKTQVSQ